MSHVGVPRGEAPPVIRRRHRRTRAARALALVTAGVLALPALAGCTSGDDAAQAVMAPPDIAPAGREQVKDGGTVRWAVDTTAPTLNAFQADADASTMRIAGAVLPSLFTLDERGRPQRNPDYLESAEIVEREPKQVVLYKINQQAVWSDGREIGAPDFLAQWRALGGRNTAYWTARNAGYERIEKIERGADDLEVRVTFAKPYADWRSLFTPLYPQDVMGSPNAFNDGARDKLKATAGPFNLKELDRAGGKATLERNPRWWGQPAKLDTLVFSTVTRDKRAAALAAGELDIADIGRSTADRIALAGRDAGAKGQQLNHGPGAAVTPASALRSWAIAHGSSEELAAVEQETRRKSREAISRYAAEQAALRGFDIRKSLEPAYTQLALNGTSGPLTDDRVRRAVARAIDRRELAEAVLKPLGLPAYPLGSHLALAGQEAYSDSSGALGDQDTQAAQALFADAGWTPGGAVKRKPGGAKAGAAAEGSESEGGNEKGEKNEGSAADEEMYIVGDEINSDSKPRGARGPESGTYVLAPAPAAALQGRAVRMQARFIKAQPVEEAGTTEDSADGKKKGGVAGAYAPRGTAAPAAAAGGPLAKDGKALTLRFVLPSGPGSESLRTVGEKIARMLERVGVRTDIVKVSDDSYFKDHVASGDYDLALYSWPATAYPATDARPIFAKPEPAADGSLVVEQNYTRVGTDHIDQLFDQAMTELDEKAARDLVKRADARIWAAAGSIPLFQRPELVAVKPDLANAGAFGFAAPRYQDIGFKKAENAKGGKN
ncbi:ABC transporter family substrate-binding protein [Streptomyces sp. ISL-96]|uniref:ABC transporter family substrate-binding protein n=1 Tax=Streptomyces sp. ISL-96 TaxID=2819191 RepID=UPI001BE78396|nr:ABC transporter family substrate-binding protein [Streptomyces sp. ISL-96]MBT2489227.1 ABC transporter family substrate-binding protein [Streptomyces sp. ISL-96]